MVAVRLYYKDLCVERANKLYNGNKSKRSSSFGPNWTSCRCVFAARDPSGSPTVEPAAVAPSADCPGSQASSSDDQHHPPYHCTVHTDIVTTYNGRED